MLEEIAIANLGLIPNSSFEPAEGLTVITGETGAGKTVMLGALRLLIGEPAGKGVIGPHGQEADVSARFIGPAQHVARRVVTPSRSKAYLDGAISTAMALRETIGPMVAIVGQHDQHTITAADGVRHLVDGSLSNVDRKKLDAYATAWSGYESVTAEAELLGTDHRHLTRELDTIRFQIGEIQDAGFQVGDDDTLREKVTKLRNADALATALDNALEYLGDEGAGANIDAAARAIDTAAVLDPTLEDLASLMRETLVSLSGIAGEMVRYTAELDTDTGHLQETEERVALLSLLKRKYGDSLEAILTFAKGASARETELDALIGSAEDIGQRLDEATVTLEKTGAALRTARQNTAERICAEATRHLLDLGFTAPTVRIDVVESRPTRTGADAPTVIFASDESLTPGSVASIASGGELSRLVLALTLAAGGADTDVVAFDEIDAGVGGQTALAMGRKLASLATSRQVLCVTHLPQVAAFADRHYVVEREGAIASIHETFGEGRTEELSRMLAGLSSSEKGKEHAEELLALAAGYRGS